MKERPILFSAPMVRALLDGRKTQTRRIVKNPEAVDAIKWIEAGMTADWSTADAAPNPYGTRGDRLWVRETWGYHGTMSSSEDRFATETVYLRYAADGDSDKRHTIVVPNGSLTDPVIQQNIPGLQQMETEAYQEALHTWWERKKRIPSIHMPRWASRITLEITSVRVERLQDISETDALAEGAYKAPKSGRVADSYAAMALAGDWFATGRGWYQDLWGRINGPESWDANPWVWVVEFKQVKP